MSTKYFLIILVILAGVIGYGYIDKSSRNVSASSANSQQVSTQVPVTKTMGVVEVEAVPTKLSPGEDGVITLRLNNHSVDLDYDFAEIATISDDLGNVYPISEWTGGKGGHHQSGELKFGKINPKAKTMRLTLSGIDNTNENFSFSI